MDGPIKVATVAALIWGIAGFVAGDFIAELRLRAPARLILSTRNHEVWLLQASGDVAKVASP